MAWNADSKPEQVHIIQSKRRNRRVAQKVSARAPQAGLPPSLLANPPLAKPSKGNITSLRILAVKALICWEQIDIGFFVIVIHHAPNAVLEHDNMKIDQETDSQTEQSQVR
jgi:hypothetical protein